MTTVLSSLDSIFARNQTVLPVELPDLGTTVPASGEVELTEGLFVYEIQESKNLSASIEAGDLLIGDSIVTLTQEESLLALTPTGRVTITENQARIELIEGGTIDLSGQLDGYLSIEEWDLSGASHTNDTVLIEDIDSKSFYIGRAVSGNSEASEVWQVKKVVENASEEISFFYADGSLLYNKSWTDRALYSY